MQEISNAKPDYVCGQKCDRRSQPDYDCVYIEAGRSPKSDCRKLRFVTEFRDEENTENSQRSKLYFASRRLFFLTLFHQGCNRKEEESKAGNQLYNPDVRAQKFIQKSARKNRERIKNKN